MTYTGYPLAPVPPAKPPVIVVLSLIIALCTLAAVVAIGVWALTVDTAYCPPRSHIDTLQSGDSREWVGCVRDGYQP